MHSCIELHRAAGSFITLKSVNYDAVIKLNFWSQQPYCNVIGLHKNNASDILLCKNICVYPKI